MIISLLINIYLHYKKFQSSRLMDMVENISAENFNAVYNSICNIGEK